MQVAQAVIAKRRENIPIDQSFVLNVGFLPAVFFNRFHPGVEVLAQPHIGAVGAHPSINLFVHRLQPDLAFLAHLGAVAQAPAVQRDLHAPRAVLSLMDGSFLIAPSLCRMSPIFK